MAKLRPALYYTIRTHSLYQPIIAVTSEKGRRRWYGRDCKDNMATNGTFEDIRGRFETLEAAQSCKAEVLAIEAEFDEQIKFHRREMNRLRESCTNKIRAYIAEKSNG